MAFEMCAATRVTDTSCEVSVVVLLLLCCSMLHKPKIVRLAVPKLASIRSMTGRPTGGRTDRHTVVSCWRCVLNSEKRVSALKPQCDNNFVSYTKSLSVFPSNVIFFDFCHLGV